MSRHSSPVSAPDLSEFEKNRSKFSPEELLKYAGEHIAWSLDGRRILASADDRETLYKKLIEAGIDIGQVVHGYVDDPNIDSQMISIWDCDSSAS